MRIINVTPHPIRFIAPDGLLYTVEPCGVVINARLVEKPSGVHPWTNSNLVKVQPQASWEDEKKLEKLEEEHPEAVIVGSMLAAQAFPGRICVLVPAEGYERKPVGERVYRDDKFTIF